MQNPTLLKMIGRRIREKRLALNVSAREMSEYLQVSRMTISNYENGKTQIPITRLAMIKDMLDITENLSGKPLKDRTCRDCCDIMFGTKHEKNKKLTIGICPDCKKKNAVLVLLNN